MKEGWELKTLGDVATFINGDRSTKYPSKKDYVVDGIPFVNAGNLSKAGLALASLNFISQSKYDSLHQHLNLPAGIGFKPSFGYTVLQILCLLLPQPCCRYRHFILQAESLGSLFP